MSGAWINGWLGALGRDLSFTTARGIRVRMLVRPGRWMAADERGRVLAAMRTLTARGTGGPELGYGILSGDDDLWGRAVLTLLTEPATGRLVGFGAMVLLPVEISGRTEDVLHLGLTMVDPAWQRGGLTLLLYALSLVLVLARRGLRPFWVSNVSQVPAVLGMVGTTLTDVYPAPSGARAPSARHATVATQIMRRHRAAFGVGAGAGFDPRRFVITDAYTGGSDHLKKPLARTAKHRDPVFETWCARELDYERGDDFLQLARFTPRVALGVLASWLVRRAERRPAPVLREAVS